MDNFHTRRLVLAAFVSFWFILIHQYFSALVLFACNNYTYCIVKIYASNNIPVYNSIASLSELNLSKFLLTRLFRLIATASRVLSWNGKHQVRIKLSPNHMYNMYIRAYRSTVFVLSSISQSITQVLISTLN